MLGEHTVEVLRELGVQPTMIADLIDKGIAGVPSTSEPVA